MLKSHVTLRLKTNASTEDVGQGATLLGESVDDWGARRGQRSFEHVAEDAKNTVKVLVFLARSSIGTILPSDTSHHLGKDHEIDNQWRSQERILTHIENAKNSQLC